ncbi:DUF1828 domain-containing protein [Salipiger abyssi]|uniref:DUF1828 domain-containing protein n=1 Tax=Salipiger abyssi TaxID=1250539 RepID=UPI0018DE1235|nr:DUF1828 domain-containing protein [Salipiger abyssi]
MKSDELKNLICREFCGGLSVSTVPAGFAVSTDVAKSFGDPISFYLSEANGEFTVEDDGDFIATAIASGTFTDTGTRASVLDAMLEEHGSYLDRDSCQIRREPIAGEGPARAALSFLSAMIRARDILLLNRENVASTFADDVRSAIKENFGNDYVIEDETEADNPADVLLKSKRTGLRAALIYAANSNEKLMAALLRHQEREDDEAPVIAVVSGLNKGGVSTRRFEMAQNRGLLMPFFSSGPKQAINYIRDHVRADAA